MYEDLREQLEANPWMLDLMDKHKKTLLLTAASEGSIECVDLLINMNCNKELKGADGCNALQACLKIGHPAQILIAEKLVESGTDINSLNALEETPLIMSIKFSLLSFASKLIGKGCDINYRSKQV